MATQARLLATERAAMASLQQVAARIALTRPGATPAALRATADDLRDGVAEEVERLRQEARTTGRSALGHEMRVAAEEAGLRGIGLLALAPTTSDLADQIAAKRAGTEYAAAWLERAADDGPAAATKATSYRLDSIAGGETGQAFGAERERAMRRLGGPEFEAIMVPLKIWDARLDACPKCAGMDGQIRPVGIGFRNDLVPGFVHRRCRCIAGLVLLSAATAHDAAA